MAKKKKSSAPPTGLFSRSKELLGLAAKVGQKELGSQINKLASKNASVKKVQTQILQAQMLVDSLSHLRGAAMKAGQMLSIEAADYLPPEVITILSKLHDSSETMSEENVQKILNENFSQETLEKLKKLSITPVASASIGQVHKANFIDSEGKENIVALKIQFPGVGKSITSDVYLLKKIVIGFTKFSGKDIDLNELFEEFAQILEQEVDYFQESKNMAKYQAMLKDDPRFIIPTPIPELSTKTVLGMSFEEGMRPQDWLDSNPNTEEREFFAKAFMDLYVSEFYEHGFVQTDPNFGNFLIRPASRQIVLLDFGAMKTYSPEFIESYKELLRRIKESDCDSLFEYAVQLKMLDSRESKECKEAFSDMLRLSIEPFLEGAPPFDFSSSEYSKEMSAKSIHFTKLIQYSPPPKDILFLHRKLSGLFRLLQRIKVKIPLQEYGTKFESL